MFAAKREMESPLPSSIAPTPGRTLDSLSTFSISENELYRLTFCKMLLDDKSIHYKKNDLLALTSSAMQKSLKSVTTTSNTITC